VSHNRSDPDPLPGTTAPPRNGPPTMADRVRALRLSEGVAAGRGSGQRSWLPWILSTVLAGTTLYFGYLASNVSLPAQQASETSTVAIKSKQAGRKYEPGGVAYEAKGYIVPARSIQVSPKVGGMVMKLNVKEGVQVQEGDILAELEKVNYQADHDRALAALLNAQARLVDTELRLPSQIVQAEAQYEASVADHQQLEDVLHRTMRLDRHPVGGRAVVADEDRKKAETGAQSAAARVKQLGEAMRDLRKRADEVLKAARAEVKSAEAELAKAKWQLDNCVVKAPVTGTILKKNTEEGNIVNPIAFNISASICEMADLADLEVDLTIQERDISKIVVGQTCRVRPDSFAEKVYTGRVSRLMPIADRAKGTVSVRVQVLGVPREEAGVYLRPEGSVLVTFLRGQPQAPRAGKGPEQLPRPVEQQPAVQGKKQ
jgi:HlyD family secretion protein